MDQITESLNLILRTRRSNACLLRHQILSKITPRLVTPLCCSDQYEGGAAFHDRRSELRGNRLGLFREKGCCGDGNLTPACFPRLEQSNLTSFLVLFLFGSYYGLDPMDHPCPSTKKYLWATVWWLASVFLRPPGKVRVFGRSAQGGRGNNMRDLEVHIWGPLHRILDAFCQKN